MIDHDYSIAEVSEQLGVSQHSLYEWVYAVKPDKSVQKTEELLEVEESFRESNTNH